MAQSDNLAMYKGTKAMLEIPYLWEKAGGSHPPTTLEVWKDMFHTAILAKIKVDIRKIINETEPEYVPPTSRE